MKKYNKQALYLEMERFYLITLESGKDDLRSVRSLVGSLVRQARKFITDELDTKQKIHLLLQLMYGEWGFYCDPNSYFKSKNLYLNYVLRSKEGMPVSLGCIVLYLADKLELPLYPVLFPTQLMLRADVDGEVAFIDPWNGRYVSQQHLEKLYEGAMGFGAKLTIEDLDIAEPEALVERFAQVAKNGLIREELNTAALKYIETRLSIARANNAEDDPYERRDRGLVLAQMGAFHAAVEDFQYFVDKCPQDPVSFLLQPQLLEMRKEVKQYLLH